MEERAAMVKKRKFSFGEMEVSVKRNTRLEDVDKSVNSEISTCESAGFDTVEASYCSSNGSIDAEKVPKMKENEATVDQYSATSIGDSFDSRKRSQSSVVQSESGELDSSPRRPQKLTSLSCFTADKMPAQDDLEEFFAAAEKKLQQEFMDKYNYDIVKDAPSEGRFEWVEILQKP